MKADVEWEQSLELVLEKGRESSMDCRVRPASQTDLGQLAACCLLFQPGRQLASFSHSLAAVGPRYLDVPLLPSISVPWEPLCCPSSMECRAGLLEAVAPVGTLYSASAILAGGTEAGVRGEGP